VKILEIVRTGALVILAVAVAWIAAHGVTFHHDGTIGISHGGQITVVQY